MLQIVYLPEPSKVFGVHNFVDVLKDAIRDFISPPVLTNKNIVLSQLAKDCLETFMVHCASFFNILLQTTGHNRARQRDRIAYLFESFCTLQEEVNFSILIFIQNYNIV